MVAATMNETNGGTMILGNNGAMAIYGRIENPMSFIDAMGKVFMQANACGVKTEPEGKVLALACMCKGVDPFELQQTYHIIDGKLSMKAEQMLARFISAGGKHKWIKDGTDKKIATLWLKDVSGEESTLSFDIQTAIDAGYVRKGSNWEKRPDQMLRARVTSDHVRMLRPDLLNGSYTPEEIEDWRTVNSTATEIPVRSAAEVEQRRKELQAEATNGIAAKVVTTPTTQATATVADSQIIDVEVEPVPFNVEADRDAKPTTADRIAVEKKTLKLAEIESIAGQFGTPVSALIAAINRRDSVNYATLDDLPDDKADAILAKLRQKLDEKNAAPRERQPGDEG